MLVCTNDATMKFLVVVALFLACANASKLSNILELIPSFPTGYVIEGVDAVPHSAPYIISLSPVSTIHSHMCGGTIISKEWILTAAHCIIVDPVGMGIIAGLHERSNVDDATQSRVVDFGMVHESYDGGVGPFDIAILHVSEPFELNENVQAAVLPIRNEIHSGETHLYGWGKPKAFTVQAAQTLQTVETEIMEWNECKETLPEDAPLHETNICSDSQQKGISACSGDSGGPLVIERNGTPAELIGIVSWGYIPCGKSNMPSVYTRVSAYIGWITSVQNAFYVLH